MQGITFNLLILNIDRGTATAPLSTTSKGFIPTTHRSIPLHELRIKTVTTTVCDPPDQFQPSKSRAGRGAPDEDSLDELTDVEKGSAISPSKPPQSHRIDAHAM